MSDLTDAVRAKAKELLESGAVKLVIGHARGTTRLYALAPLLRHNA